MAAATALAAGVMTILMGAVADYPFALATGLGLNAFVALSLATEMSWADAMGLVVLEGLIITVLVLTGFRTAVFHAIPAALKTAISVGIGLFIALIGLVDSGFVRTTNLPVPPIGLGVGGNLRGWPTLVFVLGLLATAVLVARRDTRPSGRASTCRRRHDHPDRHPTHRPSNQGPVSRPGGLS